jgi:hypothetical protein
MNMKEVEARENQHRAKGIELNKRVQIAKREGTLKSVDADIKNWLAESERIKADKDNAVMAAMKGYGATSETETKVVNAAASPLHIPASEWRGMFEAVQKRLPSYSISVGDVTTKAPFGEGNFTSGTLPPILLPQNTLQLPYEPDRLLDHFIQQAAPIGPGVEWIAHTGNTLPANVVNELAQKPDLGMLLTTHTASWVKIAALCSISMEISEDFQHFMQFVPNEIYRAIIDAETNAFVNSVSNPVGLLNVSGTLTRAVGADTNIDAIRKAMNDIRVSSSFGKADLIAMHPTTWDTVSLSKATTGSYLLNPDDPSAVGNLTSIFGAEVVTNTYIPLGKALVLDSSKAVLRWVRSGFRLEINSYGSDPGVNYWSQNAIGFRGEIREQIGVQYPTAICVLTGLPTS